MSTGYVKSAITTRVVTSALRFIGRQHELEIMREQYEVAKNGYARVVLLVGEQGIGKSRLLHEFAKRTMHDEPTILRGGASELEGMPPYLPFLEALGRYIRETPLDELREQVGLGSQILAGILPELATRLGELPVSYALPPEQMRLRLYEAVGIFLEKISTSHVLVLELDDLHWVDSASLDLLCHVLRSQSQAKLLVLGTYREDEIKGNAALQKTISKLVQQRILISLAVEPLSAEEIAFLAESYLGDSVSPIVSQILFIQSEGNPFFAEELMRSWIEKGEVIQKNGQWTAVAPLEHALPQSIVGVLRQRFAQLLPDVIDHLRVAAIIGRTFDLSLLAAVENQEAEVLEEYLLEAIRVGLIRTNQIGVFTFSHDKIRECLYAEVSTSRRRRLHEGIGQVLASRYDLEETRDMYQLAELAFHFTQSGDRVRGVAYSERTAEQALQSSAFKEAVTYYHLALELLHRDDPRRSHLLLGLGEAALLANFEREAAVAYKEALAFYSRSGETEAAVRAAHGLALAHWQAGSLQAAWMTLEHTLALLGDSQSAMVVRVLVDLATLLTINMDRQVEGMSYAQRALEMAIYLGDNSLEAAANRAVAGKLYSPGNDISFATHTLEHALELAEGDDNSSEAAECCFLLARAYYWMAEIRRSYAMISRMIEFIERSQQPYQLRNALPWLALLHISHGAWTDAEQAIERAQPIVKQVTSPFPSAFLHQIRGFLAYEREDYQTAENEFRAASMYHQVGPEKFMFFTGFLELTFIALGKREEVCTHVARLEVFLSELRAGTLATAPILTCLSLIAIALGDHERAANLYSILRAFRGQHYWFLVDRVLGQIATLLKDWDMAVVYLNAAKETAKCASLRPELARTLYALADFEVAHGGQASTSRAIDSLRQALSLFDELNMPFASTQARNRLNTLLQRSLALQLLPADLTKSEARVLQLVSRGRKNRQIARELGISEKTVANHLTHIFAKTASENRAAATAFAIHHKLD